MTKDSLAKVADLQDRLSKSQERHVKASQQLKELEDKKKRTSYAQEQAKVGACSVGERMEVYCSSIRLIVPSRSYTCARTL